MCVVSMVSDHYKDKWSDPNSGMYSYTGISSAAAYNSLFVSRLEFEELKKEVLEMKELLKKAKEYDDRTNQPNCEIEEKMELLKKIAKVFNVDLDDVLGKK